MTGSLQWICFNSTFYIQIAIFHQFRYHKYLWKNMNWKVHIYLYRTGLKIVAEIRILEAHDRFLPSRLAQTLTVKPDRLDGSVMSGNSRFLKLKRSSMPGKMPKLGVLMDSLISTSSWVFAIWYTWPKCSGWYLYSEMISERLWITCCNDNFKHICFKSCPTFVQESYLKCRPEYQNTGGHQRVGQKCSYRHQINQVLQIKEESHDSCMKSERKL